MLGARRKLPPEPDERPALRQARELADQVFSRAAGAPLVPGNQVRVLKDAVPGQKIEVVTRNRTHVFRVVSTEVVEATDPRPLADTLDPTVTLVTCFPFYFIGHAPQRFIVRGEYDWASKETST